MGLKMSTAFPSNYIRAADLQGRTVRVVMRSIAMEDIGDDHKPVLYFQGKEKGLVLNKTNGNNISMVYGDDSDNWMGQVIELYPTMVDFQGRSVEAIRVRVPRVVNRPPAPPPVAAAPPSDSDFDDSIPF